MGFYPRAPNTKCEYTLTITSSNKLLLLQPKCGSKFKPTSITMNLFSFFFFSFFGILKNWEIFPYILAKLVGFAIGIPTTNLFVKKQQMF
jgi:hypothetical protein